MILLKELSFRILNSQLMELKRIGLFPCIGSELEFYLTKADNNFNEASWQAERLDLDLDLAKEEGLNQFEVRIKHTRDILSLAEEIEQVKEKIKQQAKKQGMTANFSAKPFVNRPGSAMHIHLHLENELDENLFIRKNNQDAEILLHSIGGLCFTMLPNMLFFAPYSQAYQRYKEHSLQSPSKVCWGPNNRSAAIRIPRDNKIDRRLEHRVAASDSLAIEVINAILFGVIKGIKEKIEPPEKVYGNAFQEQYNYPLLPQNIEEAKEYFRLNRPDFLK